MRLQQMLVRGAAAGAAVVALGFVYGAWFVYSRHGLAGLHRMTEITPGDVDLFEWLIPISFALGFASVPLYYVLKWLDERVRGWWARQRR